MPNRGFEVELGMALQRLLKGYVLDDIELQVINCATEEELRTVFDKVYSRLLYSEVEEDIIKIRNLKTNLKLISSIKEGQSIIVDRELGTRIITSLYPEEFKKKYKCDPQITLEKGIKSLLKGLPLTEAQILSITVSGPINLHETFEFIYAERLSGISEDLAENFILNMYNLLSLKLLDHATVSGVEIPSISKEQYEYDRTKKF